MGSTVSKPAPSSPLNSLDSVRPTPAKAALRSQAQSIAMTAIVKSALIRHYGSLKSAAISMGQMDEGQLHRDLDTGKFKFERLQLCDDEAKAFVTEALHEAFRQGDAKSQARRLIRDARTRLDELAELIEQKVKSA